MVQSILNIGDGTVFASVAAFEMDAGTRLDLDRYDSGRLALWVGNPILLKLGLDREALERLHSFLGAALQELDGAAPETVLVPEREREAIRE